MFLTQVLTVRGKTGAVACATAIHSEASDRVVAALAKALSGEERAQILHIASDDPSRVLFTALRATCPSLQTMSLDACHLVMKYESAQWRKSVY